MRNRSGEKIKLASIDELLGVVNEESAMEIEINRIHAFKDHPFKVLDDEKMADLVESVKVNGVLTPVLLRSDGEDGYEMISGHRRMHATVLAGLETIPAIVRELSDDDAVIAMVDKSNHIVSADGIGSEEDEMETLHAYQSLIKDNLDYDSLLVSHPHDKNQIDEIVDLIVETVMCKSDKVLIASNWYSGALVRGKFMKLDYSHVEYVLHCLEGNTSKIKNIKKYLLAALFNAPDGFVTSNEEKEFTFEYGKPEEAEVSYEFVFENESTTVELTKTDLTTGKELPGAHLKVTDEDGNVIEEWVSTDKAHVIKELTVGKSYTMTETKPADGYVTAESITFTVENTAEIQKQEMKDDVTKVLISKQDIAGKELSGAKLTILDEDGKVVESWTSTEEAHYIEMIPIGKYTLREETAPEGYLVAKDVEFEVKDTAEVQKVVMVDEEKPKESTPEGGKPSKDAPKTGDNTNLLLWLIVLGMSLSGVVVLGRKIKKK